MKGLCEWAIYEEALLPPDKKEHLSAQSQYQLRFKVVAISHHYVKSLLDKEKDENSWNDQLLHPYILYNTMLMIVQLRIHTHNKFQKQL